MVLNVRERTGIMKTVEQRKQSWIDLYARKKRRVFQINIEEEEQGRPLPWPCKAEEKISFILKKYDKMLNRVQWLDDDTVPFLDMMTGTEIFAEAFGCRVYRPENDMPSAIPFIKSAMDAAKVKVPKLSETTLAYLFDIADKVYKEAGSDSILRLVDIQTPIDIAAIMWEKTDFYAALITESQAVLELCEKIKTLLYSFMDEWFKRYSEDFVAHSPCYYMPYGITVSEDEVGVVSPATFNKMFLGELIDISERYGQIGIHCCADSEHQWENFRKIPGLVMLNLNRPTSSCLDHVEYFKDFTALMPVNNDGENIDAQYAHDACIAFTASVKDRDGALRTLDAWQQLV